MSASAKRTIVLASAAGGALLLLISLFLDWYKVETSEDLGQGIANSISFSGWTALEFADGFLLFVALAAAWLALGRLRNSPERDDSLLVGLGLAATTVVLVLFLTKNSVLAMITAAIDLAEEQPGASNVPVDVSAELGAILALMGALAILAAGLVDSLVKPSAAQATTASGYGTGAAPGGPGYGRAGTPASGAGTTTPAGGAPAAAQQTTPAGWYPDPHGQARERYWDGSQWTAHTR